MAFPPAVVYFPAANPMTTTTQDSAIDLHHVTKVYGKRVHALQDISLNVRRGEVFGLLGPNGAGKSTLIKIMMTVVRATHAEGTILGQRVGHKPTLARVGYLPEHHRFPRYLTGPTDSGIFRRTFWCRSEDAQASISRAG